MKKRTKARAKALFGTGLGILAMILPGLTTGCKRSDNAGSSSASSSQNGDATEQPYFKTSFQTESQFVLESIVTDITELLCFAHSHALPSKPIVVTSRETGGTPDAPSYELTIQIGSQSPIKTKLDLSGPIWAPATYAEVTSTVAKALQLQSPATVPADDVSILDRLANGKAETIAVEDMDLSRDLEKDFTNPALHEQSAALLGAFMLREHSGLFFDIRLPLNRMTAHLAVAQFLAGDHPRGTVGKVADCMLLTGMNNQAAALEQLARLDSAQKEVATWARTLRAINTLDFRPLDTATNVPGIEQLAWFQAYSRACSGPVAWQKMGNAVADRTDFCRMGAAPGYSVEMGNALLQIWLPLEAGEAMGVYKTIHGKALSPKNLVAALNSEPDRCFIPESPGTPHVRVIGWGLWALQLQHHLCQAISIDYFSLNHKLGLPEESAQFAKESEKGFGGLRFYDFVRRLNCNDEAAYRKSVDDGWAFTVKYPHLTPVSWMVYLCGRVPFAPLYSPIPNPHCNEWTSHNPLPGTAYDADARVYFPSFTGDTSQDMTKVKKALELAPYDVELGEIFGRMSTGKWTYEAANSIFGRMLPYSSIAAAAIGSSQTGNPEQYEKTMLSAAKWDPRYYRILGDYQWDHGRTNDAIKTYELQEKYDPDAVALSHLAERRVEYYLATGQRQKAKAVADFAGEVYSAGGLAAKALYLEKTGNLSGAFDWYAKIEERYNTPGELAAFCSRHTKSTGDASLDKRIKDRLQSWASQRESASLKDFTKPPRDGVLLESISPMLEKLSVKSGDVIVAMRGYRIHNLQQFFLTRDIEKSSQFKMIYWDGASYKEATVTLDSDHRLGADVDDYKAE